jgi:hypothetical protein
LRIMRSILMSYYASSKDPLLNFWLYVVYSIELRPCPDCLICGDSRADKSYYSLCKKLVPRLGLL